MRIRFPSYCSILATMSRTKQTAKLEWVQFVFETNTSMALVAFSIIILSVYLLRHILKININHKKLPITLSMRKKYQFYVWRFVTVINFNHCRLILYIFWWEDIIAAKCFSPEFWTTSIIFFRWKCRSFV